MRMIEAAATRLDQSMRRYPRAFSSEHQIAQRDMALHPGQAWV
ncbi:MAG: hypothetical protein AB7G34_11085 [Hyphomicrobiales bacterium]